MDIWVDPLSVHCYSIKMNKLKKILGSSVEGVLLLVLLVLFAGVLGASWKYAINVKSKVSQNVKSMTVDPSALIEVEHLRSLALAEISDSRGYFLLGSKALFDKRQKQKDNLAASLASFEKNYSLDGVSDIIKKIQTLEESESDFFEQGLKFREKATESKIVGQFYQSKTAPIANQLNEHFDQIVKLHDNELANAKTRAAEAGQEAQDLIPRGMRWLTLALAAIFACISLLVLKMIWSRQFYLRERIRLVDEAKKGILARDEVITAVSQDLKDSLNEIRDTAQSLTALKNPEVTDKAELIKTTVVEIEGLINDIYDQKKSDLGTLTLRLEQLGVADILDDAQTMLLPLAKKRDVGLQVDSVNESILAFVDRERVMRVLTNLIGNAIKYSRKHTKILVKVRSDQQFVNISIADTGPGIPSNQLPTLFDNFWQARRTADQGAGVGLAVVKTIIEAHGGTVKADSNVGQGSTFTFSLPRRRPVGANLKKPSASTVRKIARTTPPDQQV